MYVCTYISNTKVIDMTKEYKNKFGKFEKATNGNFKCPVCKRSMWKTEEAVSKHALKCPGRSSKKSSEAETNKEKLPRTVKKISRKKKENIDVAKLKKDLKTCEEALKTARDTTVRKTIQNRKYYLKNKLKEAGEL